MGDGWSAPAVLRPNTDSFRITCSLAQAGHATAVAAPGTYFSNSRSHCLQLYSYIGILLAASLHVALDELLGVLLEDVIDLVEELVDVFLDLLALLGQLRARSCSVAAFSGLRRPGFFLLLLSHLALHGATNRVAKPRGPLLDSF